MSYEALAIGIGVLVVVGSIVVTWLDTRSIRKFEAETNQSIDLTGGLR